MTQEDEIICEIRGAAGVVVLNRPKALNALSLDMVRKLSKALDAWESDPQVTRVVVSSSSQRAFCAGGDIRSLYDYGKAGCHDEMLTFLGAEYLLNHRVKTYPKPYVSLIDGIVMGGGVGISLHGSHRIAGSRYLFAMPEVGIGFFPDIGTTYALPRLPGSFGRFLALTGERVGAADALSVGLATHAVPSERVAELAGALTENAALDEIIGSFSVQQDPGPRQAERAVIAEAFSGETLPEIIERLRVAAANGNGFSGRLLQTIASKSPTSVAIAFEQMRRGVGLELEEALRTEYRIAARIVHGHDFYEGVRAVVIDKGQTPHWQPATLDAVRSADIEAYFETLGARELGL